MSATAMFSIALLEVAGAASASGDASARPQAQPPRVADVIDELRGGQLRQLTFDAARDMGPKWAPSGETLSFASDRTTTWNAWRISRHGSEPVQMTSGPAADTRPSWAPDGTAIAFNSDRSGNVDIWLLTAQEEGDSVPSRGSRGDVPARE